jgi:hypothetical protein
MGSTSGKSRRDHKHDLRKCFHTQLRELWNQVPFSERQGLLDPTNVSFTDFPRPGEGSKIYLGRKEEVTVITPFKNFQFAATVSSRLHMVADLAITLLRPEEPGKIVTQSGDIDNRLKTLLDALKVPSQPSDLPYGATPAADESPFFCLVEDDNLITGLDITTDRLLEPVTDSSDAVLLINVKTKLLKANYVNISFT